jgi:hypothetical protein
VLTRNPYYLIEVRVAGTESYAQIRVDDTADLMNQRAIQRACIRQLKYAPASMKQAAWLSRLNSEVLGKIEDQQVSETSDMTEESLLHQHFLRYLTHGQTQNSAPYMVALGHVYYRDGVYSFDGGGFKSYLATLNFKLTDMNLRAELESYGCAEGKLSYTTAKGAEKTIACWQKAEDETLREMCVFYDEIYGENAEAVKRIKLEKDDEEVSDGDDTRF